MGSLLAWFFAAFVAAGSFAFILRLKGEQIDDLRAQLAESKAQLTKALELIDIVRGENADLKGQLNLEVGINMAPIRNAKTKRAVKDINHPPEESHDRRNEPAEADWSTGEEDGNE